MVMGLPKPIKAAIFTSDAETVKLAPYDAFDNPPCHVPFLATDVVHFPPRPSSPPLLLLRCRRRRRRLGMYICEGDLISISLKYFAYLITHFNVVGRWRRCRAAALLLYVRRARFEYISECLWLEKPRDFHTSALPALPS